MRCTIVAPDGDSHPPVSIAASLARGIVRTGWDTVHHLLQFQECTQPAAISWSRADGDILWAFVTPPFVLIGAVNACVKQVLCHRPLK